MLLFIGLSVEVMVTELVHKFKFESSSQETSWAVSTSLRFLITLLLKHIFQAFVIQLPFIKKEAASPGRLPKLPLRVTEIQSS